MSIDVLFWNVSPPLPLIARVHDAPVALCGICTVDSHQVTTSNRMINNNDDYNHNNNSNNTKAKDVLPNIHHTQAAVSMHSCHPRLRRNGPISCCMWFAAYDAHVTMHCQWEWLSSFPQFYPWWPWPLTLTFKLVRARDQTRLPYKFGTNLFSRSRDISVTNEQKKTKKRTNNLSQTALKTEPFLACGKNCSMHCFLRYSVILLTLCSGSTCPLSCGFLLSAVAYLLLTFSYATAFLRPTFKGICSFLLNITSASIAPDLSLLHIFYYWY